MPPVRDFFRRIRRTFISNVNDDHFLAFLKIVETFVAKVLSLAMIVVLLVAIGDLCRYLVTELLKEPYGSFNVTLIEIFGLFLNVLIALEVLENITAYLKNHVVQVELVLVTSLTAVARKIIIFDSKNAEGLDLIGLGIATFALAVSYWIVRRANRIAH